MHAASLLDLPPRPIGAALRDRSIKLTNDAAVLNRILARRYHPSVAAEWHAALDLAHQYRRAAETVESRGVRVWELRERVRCYAERLSRRRDPEALRAWMLLDGANARTIGPRGVLP